MVEISSGIPTFDPGKLRHRIDIQEQTTERTEQGSKKQIWTPIRSPKAAIELLGMRGPTEFFQGGQLAAESSHVIVIRWFPININASMRVALGAQTFKVKAVDDVMQMHLWIQLFCSAFNEETNPDPK